MSLSSAQLDALGELAKSRSFSGAAKNLAVTQSALSQRIANLEKELGTSLLVREPQGIRFTAAGEKLLRYWQVKASLETECLAEIQSGNRKDLSGILRIGGYSTIMRSIVLPSISPLLAKNPNVRVELFTKELAELSNLLRTGEAEFVFLDKASDSAGIESQLLGYEENVLIESKAKKVIADVYLDHDQKDQTTHQFFEIQQQKPKNIRRSFFDEIYGIMDGVAMGLGKAVVPKHLAVQDNRVRVVPGLKPLLLPVYLHYYRQPFYTELQKLALACLTKEIPGWLRQKSFS